MNGARVGTVASPDHMCTVCGVMQSLCFPAACCKAAAGVTWDVAALRSWISTEFDTVLNQRCGQDSTFCAVVSGVYGVACTPASRGVRMGEVPCVSVASVVATRAASGVLWGPLVHHGSLIAWCFCVCVLSGGE